MVGRVERMQSRDMSKSDIRTPKEEKVSKQGEKRSKGSLRQGLESRSKPPKVTLHWGENPNQESKQEQKWKPTLKVEDKIIIEPVGEPKHE